MPHLSAPVDLPDGARARVLVEDGQLHLVLDGEPGIRVASWGLDELGLTVDERVLDAAVAQAISRSFPHSR